MEKYKDEHIYVHQHINLITFVLIGFMLILFFNYIEEAIFSLFFLSSFLLFLEIIIN